MRFLSLTRPISTGEFHHDAFFEVVNEPLCRQHQRHYGSAIPYLPEPHHLTRSVMPLRDSNISAVHPTVAGIPAPRPMDDMLLMLVHPASEGDNEKGKRIQKRVH